MSLGIYVFKTVWSQGRGWIIGASCASMVVAISGAILGGWYLEKPHEYPYQDKETGLRGMVAWDGEWYSRIAAEGYTFSTSRQSSIGFFPLYPACGRVLSAVCGVEVGTALVIISNVSMLLAVVTMWSYVRVRWSADEDRRSCICSIWLLCLLPTSLFFHMAYTESLFLLLSTGAMLGMRLRWNGGVIALIIGAATGTRSAGMALLVPFAIYLRRTGPSRTTEGVCRQLAFLVIGIWGIALWMGWQSYRFGDAFAFTKAPQMWADRIPGSGGDRAVGLVIGESIIDVYRVCSVCHWSRHAPHKEFLLNLYFWNPIVFVATVGLVIVGAIKGWLDIGEWSLAVAMLAIPYVMVSYRVCMTSQARYASVAFPAYLVAGRLLASIPTVVTVYVLLISAFVMGIYCALFTSWYPVL